MRFKEYNKPSGKNVSKVFNKRQSEKICGNNYKSQHKFRYVIFRI